MRWLLFCLVFIVSCKREPTVVFQEKSPFVTEVHFNNYDSGKKVSEIHSKSSLKFKNITPDFFRHARRGIPFILPFKNNKPMLVIQLKNKSTVKAIELETLKPLWESKVPSGTKFSGVASLKYKKIYYLSVKNKNRSYQHYLTSIDFDTGRSKVYDMDLGSIFKKQGLTKKDYEFRSHCKTGLTIIEDQKGSSLVFGCSRNIEKGINYGDRKGLSGLVLKYRINQEGDIITPMDQYFLSSEIRENKKLGYDTGIYNVGAQVSVLPDNTFLVATGNGPVDLKENNYGCSIVRLDSELKPVFVSGKKQAFSLDDSPSESCWKKNNEFTTSPPTIFKINDKLVATTMSKEGVFYSFDPLNFYQSHPKIKSLVLGGIQNYGKTLPLSFNTGKTNIYINLFSETKINKSGMIALSYDSKKEEFKKSFHFTLPKDYTPNRFHLVATMNEKKQNPLIIMTAKKMVPIIQSFTLLMP